ncbi:MAG: DUF4190 domain-containing protein [Dehalococcoidia bacterium]
MEAKRPKGTPGEAIASLVCAIVGLTTLGIILGPIAIVLAKKARRKIQEDPELEGDGIATAGLVIGIVDTALWAVGIIIGILVLLIVTVCTVQVGP